MKITGMLLTIACLQVSANGFSQNISFSGKNVMLEKVFSAIEKQSGYSFFYRYNELRQSSPVSLDVKDVPVEEVLRLSLRDQPFTYTIEDKTIVVMLKQEESPEPVAAGQELLVSGVVRDSTGIGLPGVTVEVKGTGLGAATDEAGHYIIEVPGREAVLVFTYLGYRDQELTVGANTTLNVTMSIAAEGLDEVIVVGYGMQKRSDLTGVIASVRPDQFVPAISPTPQAALAGKVAGVSIQQNSAQPGAAMSIHIRGNNDPLFVIDGFPVSNGVTASTDNYFNSPSPDGFNFINPGDIESIEILKDAAATSIYGARGSNGVVLITTKKGVKGRASIAANVREGAQYQLQGPEMLGAQIFGKQVNAFRKFLNQTPLYTDEYLRNAGQGTDWVDLVSRTGAFSQYQVSLNGGVENTQYYVSGDVYRNKGIMKNSDFNKYSGRINLDHKGNRYRLSVNSTYAYMTNNGISSNTNMEDQNSSILHLARQFTPLLPVKNTDGTYALNPDASFLPNPVSLLEVTDYQEKNKLLANASLEYDFFENLFGRVEVGLENEVVQRNFYMPRSTLNGSRINGEANINQNKVNNTRVFASLNYNQSFGLHHFNAVLGAEKQTFLYNGHTLGGTNFPTDALLYHNMGLGDQNTNRVGSYQSAVKWLSYLGRVNYSFRNKYLFTGTFRYDGSPKFAKGNRFRFYPSLSAGWRMDQEEFLKNSEVISQLKLRMSWGRTGQDNFAVGDVIPLLDLGKVVLGDRAYFTAGQNRITNPDLGWQTTTEVNAGFDFGLFSNRITGAFDIYNRTISNLLYRVNIDPDKGFDSAPANQGKQSNKGWEFTLNVEVVNNNALSWDISGNLFRNTFTWIDRQDPANPLLYRGENDPLDAIYGYKVTGIIREASEIPSSMPNAKPGMWIFEDFAGRDQQGNFVNEPDGQITSDDQTYLGTEQPRLNWGLSSYLKYKRLSFSFTVQAMQDRYSHNVARAFFAYPYRLIDGTQNMFTEVLDRWSPENPSGRLASGEPNPYGDETWNSYFIENSSFVRVRNISLAYQVPLSEHLPVKDLRVSLDVNNPFLFTNYKGFDPETGTDLDPYPNVRTYLVGISINL